MKPKGIRATLFAILLAMVSAGCSDGGGGSAPAAAQIASRGVITALGSAAVVNGVKFTVADANVVIDGKPNRPQTDLKVGMVVTVTGTIDAASQTGAASRVEFADDLEGPVTAIDLAANTLTVLGQRVTVVPTTVFEDTADITTLAVNNIVEVSDFPDDSGALQATRIELKLAAPVATTPIEVKGTVANLDSAAKTFMIGDLTVDYASATLDDFPAGGIADGQVVEVKGIFGQLAGATLAAASVELEAAMAAEENAQVEMEGIVTNFVAGATVSTFTVNGVNVSADNALLAGVADGVEVEVEGSVVDGVLVASAVKLEEEDNIKLEADATAIDPTAGTVTLLGIPVSVNADTELKDGSGAKLQSFGLGDLAVGDHLQVVGFLDADGKAVASKLERRDPDARKIIQGPVGAASPTDNTLTILGVTIDTAGAEFEGMDEAPPVTAAEFFAAIVPGETVVKAKGTLFNDNTLTATEVEIEGEDE